MFQPGFKVIHQNEFYDENEDEFDVNFEQEVGFLQVFCYTHDTQTSSKRHSNCFSVSNVVCHYTLAKATEDQPTRSHGMFAVFLCVSFHLIVA